MASGFGLNGTVGRYVCIRLIYHRLGGLEQIPERVLLPNKALSVVQICSFSFWFGFELLSVVLRTTFFFFGCCCCCEKSSHLNRMILGRIYLSGTKCLWMTVYHCIFHFNIGQCYILSSCLDFLCFGDIFCWLLRCCCSLICICVLPCC